MHHTAAVHVDCLTSHLAGSGTAEKHDHRGNVFRLLPTAKWDDLIDFVARPFVVRQTFIV